MAQYCTTAVLTQDRIYDNKTDDFSIRVDFDRKLAPSAGQMLLVSLASCKLVSLLELRKKYNMDISWAAIEVNGVTGRGESPQGSGIPTFRFQKIDYLFKVDTEHSEAELYHYLTYVNAACVVVNSMSDKGEETYRIQKI